MDLATLDTAAACNSGAEIELRHPVTNAALGIFWGVVGRDSDAFRAHIRQSVNAKLRKEAMARKRGRDSDVPTIEQSEEEGVDLLVACSTHWRTVKGDANESMLEFEGTQLPFNAANARRVLSSPKVTWIKKQIDEGIADLENFMQV